MRENLNELRIALSEAEQGMASTARKRMVALARRVLDDRPVLAEAGAEARDAVADVVVARAQVCGSTVYGLPDADEAFLAWIDDGVRHGLRLLRYRSHTRRQRLVGLEDVVDFLDTIEVRIDPDPEHSKRRVMRETRDQCFEANLGNLSWDDLAEHEAVEHGGTVQMALQRIQTRAFRFRAWVYDELERRWYVWTELCKRAGEEVEWRRWTALSTPIRVDVGDIFDTCYRDNTEWRVLKDDAAASTMHRK